MLKCAKITCLTIRTLLGWGLTENSITQGGIYWLDIGTWVGGVIRETGSKKLERPFWMEKLRKMRVDSES